MLPDTVKRVGHQMARKVKKQNKIGQTMGNKGLDTHRRIIDQTMMLLRSTTYNELSAADVARASDLTPPALYLYFKGIPEIVLARLEEIKGLHHRYLDILNKPWEGKDALPMARSFVEAYVDYWTEFGVALRYRNFMSEQGDERFRQARSDMSFVVADNFAKRVARAQARGLLPKTIDGLSAAGAVMALVEHVAGTSDSHLGTWDGRPLRQQDMLDVAAYMIVRLLQGASTSVKRKHTDAKGRSG
jgi:AcrR family transcriptional regulator